MIKGIDVATPQRSLNFPLASSLGHRACYVKLGGDNSGRYVAPCYGAQVQSARAAGFAFVGHYWVPDAAQDPVGAANWFVDHLQWQSGDFIVLDNEDLDGAHRYSDADAAKFIRQVRKRLGIGSGQALVYLGLAVARSNDWPQLLATGCNFIISAYSYTAFAFDLLGKIPPERVVGHQYTDVGNIGGVQIDLDVFQDDAFAFTGIASLDTTPLEDDLNSEQDNMLKNIYAAIFNGGRDMKDSGKSLSQSVAEINKAVSQRVLRDTNGDGKEEPVSQIQDNADTNTMVRSLLVQVGTLSEVAKTLAVANGLDPDALSKLVAAAAQKGAASALASIKLGGTVTLETPAA